MLFVPWAQPPAAQHASSTYQPQPAGPGLPSAEPSAAAMIVTTRILPPQRRGILTGVAGRWPGRAFAPAAARSAERPRTPVEPSQHVVRPGLDPAPGAAPRAEQPRGGGAPVVRQRQRQSAGVAAWVGQPYRR